MGGACSVFNCFERDDNYKTELFRIIHQIIPIKAGNMAEIKNEENEKIVNRFFGIFFGIFQTNQIGNLLSSVIIHGSGVPQFSQLPVLTQDQVEETAGRCGVNQERSCIMSHGMTHVMTQL